MLRGSKLEEGNRAEEIFWPSLYVGKQMQKSRRRNRGCMVEGTRGCMEIIRCPWLGFV